MNSTTRTMVSLMPALALNALLFSLVPAHGEEQVTWLGVTLGAPAAMLRQTLGDPILVTRYPNESDPGIPPQRIARYWVGGTPMFLLVGERYGRVTAIQVYTDATPIRDLPSVALVKIPPDPSGVVLGQTLAEVSALRPNAQRQGPEGEGTLVERRPDVVVNYDFSGGRLYHISWRVASPAATPPSDVLPELAEPAGDSFSTAILDSQTAELTGVRWEYVFLTYHRCAADQSWKKQKQTLARRGAQIYDLLHVTCPTTGAERDFYFDITPYFGK